ncbi:GNAT family N-acetyltransferase [Amycolatopsis sp. cmx-4-61]|uniref:GNAT family N-acetyltransferase n=1 Tax=Amycolatopsis sp. cmx-4-61 TaxID=2790937 RepID=UPI00397A38AF
MKLRGYRGTDRELLTGPWLAGELLGLPIEEWPVLAEPTQVPPPAGPDEELCVADGAFVRYTGIDWVHRRARVEIGVHSGLSEVDALLEAVVAHGFTGLNLRRLHGWVTPAAAPGSGALAAAGFRREAVVPAATWFDGAPAAREIWGTTRHD